MNRFLLQSIGRLPFLTLIIALFALLAIGCLFVHSTTGGSAQGFPSPTAERHLIRVAIGLAVFVFLVGVRYRTLEEWALPLYGFGIALLCALFAVKLGGGGGKPSSWFELPGFALQPAELMKLFTILLLARALKPTLRAANAGEHLRPLLITGIPALLIAAQPDLGTALAFPPVLLAMLWVGGASTKRVASYAGAGVACALLVLCAALFADVGLRGYQKNRILAFFDRKAPEYAMNEAYQPNQSLIAIGSGGLFGKGLGQGPQNVRNRLPEKHNDFIFGIIGEEWGLAGTILVTMLFAMLYLSCAGIAYRTREPFGRLVAIGITVQLASQTLMNLAIATGLAPVTGITLPFISFGGSSLLTSLASIGIVLGIGLHRIPFLAPLENPRRHEQLVIYPARVGR
ncbi:MAG: rod shape-determining protein RodA [Planctomycetes bacterium]|nr:rod shape-determining protein RodA [Planctomycetota bacterium]